MEALSNYQLQRFFKEFGPITQVVCDETAAAIHGGGTVKLVNLQGAESYTVSVDDGTMEWIVQFREPNRPLDVDLQAAARETYGPLVPRCRHLQGQLDPLHVYIMEKMTGESLLSARETLHHPQNVNLLSRAVRDFAVFTASAWHSRPVLIASYVTDSIQSDYLFRLGRISEGLPLHFRPLLDKLKLNLPLLFTDEYPMVINHEDLLENNIHVDVDTGQITGIVDWRDAKVGPFAVQLWGLENILGIRGSASMRYHSHHVELRELFWQTFHDTIGDVDGSIREAIQTARMLGIFMANGDFVSAPAEENERNLAVLDSMISNLPDIGL